VVAALPSASPAAASERRAAATTATPPPATRPAGATERPAAARAAPAAAKPAPSTAKPAPAATEHAARVWVQVSGGADKAALPRDFARLKEKAPAALGSRTAWTVPTPTSNRVLVGPFRNTTEAQTFVNELGKAGISAFHWSSAAGQKIEKLPAR
jgi:hypothetical protein